MNRRRLGGGLAAVTVSGLLGVAVHVSAAWALEAGPTQLVFFVLPDWALILCAHLVSGAAAVTGLALLLPPLLRHMSRTWLRRVAVVLSAAAAAAASLPWLVYLVGLGVNAAGGTYTTVTAEDGHRVMVYHSGFDRRDYSVFRQKSPFLWQRSLPWQSAQGFFDPATCILTVREPEYLLTCGNDRIPIPPPGE